MSEMYIPAKDTKKIVDDYDFIFTSGMLLPVVIDDTLGDTILFEAGMITIALVAKPSMNDSAVLLPSEEVFIYTSHLASIQHRQREVQLLTADQKAEWQKSFQELSSNVH